MESEGVAVERLAELRVESKNSETVVMVCVIAAVTSTMFLWLGLLTYTAAKLIE